MNEVFESKLAQLLASADDNASRLEAIAELVGRTLQAHRCCLFLRHPVTRMSRVTHEWVCDPQYVLKRDSTSWQVESPTLESEDPMFAEALVCPDALYIEDVRTADPALVNGPFEERNFGHRALVHAPLYHAGSMYGILEPCVFNDPRDWSSDDREVVRHVQTPLAAIAAAYVREQLGD